MMKSTAVVVGLLVVVGGYLWYAGYFGKVAEAPTESEQTVPAQGETQGFARLSPNALYLAEQWPGTEIVVNIVNLEKPGYVVIQEKEGEKPGRVLGTSALITDTESKNVVVKLSRPIANGEELIAALYQEHEGTGFDIMTDPPVIDFSNNAMFMNFVVNKDALDPKDAQVAF